MKAKIALGRFGAIGRSSLYSEPKGESAETLAPMRRIDALFLKYPFYGARQMVRHLRREPRGGSGIRALFERPRDEQFQLFPTLSFRHLVPSQKRSPRYSSIKSQPQGLLNSSMQLLIDIDSQGTGTWLGPTDHRLAVHGLSLRLDS